MAGALVLLATAVSSWGAAPAPAEAVDPFPDTPNNRALYEDSLKTYEAVDKAHGHFAVVNGVRMHYLEWGKPAGIPLIWSHGYSSTGFEMLQVGQGLADLGYHVFAITYRGHGQTQVADYNFSLADIADDIAALMDQRRFPCAVIGGLSLGGGVTTTFYENYPRRAIALVLEDGGVEVQQNFVELHFEALKKLIAAMPPATNEGFADRFQAFRAAASPYLWLLARRPEAAAIMQSFVRRDDAGSWRLHIDPARLLGTGEASVDPARNHELPLLAQSWRRVNPIITFRRLGVPVLMIDPTGDDDGPVGSFSPDFDRLQALHPAFIRVVRYPDTPHVAHPLQPDWFVRDMKDLRDRIRVTHSDACLGRH